MSEVWAGAAVGAALLVVTARRHPQPVDLRRSIAVVLLVVAALGAGVAGWQRLLPLAVVGAAAAGFWSLRARSRRGQQAIERGEKVRECCDALAAELGAGIPPGRALAVAEEIWPPWRQISAAHGVGSSVPAAMCAVARDHPGAGDLIQVAAAWELSHHSGAALASSLTSVAEEIADKQTTRALVRTELSSARSTARLVVALPVMTLAVGSGNGDPVGWLFSTPGGWICLAGGAALALAGLAWIERIAAAVEREPT